MMSVTRSHSFVALVSSRANPPFVRLFVIVVLVYWHLVITEAERCFRLTSSCESCSDHVLLSSSVFNKRLSTQWGKRLQTIWGKRSDSDKSELYQHLLRGLYHNARLNRPQYAADNDRRWVTRLLWSPTFFSSPLDLLSASRYTLEEFMAQRSARNNDSEKEAKNLF